MQFTIDVFLTSPIWKLQFFEIEATAVVATISVLVIDVIYTAAS